MSQSPALKDIVTIRDLCERRYGRVWADEIVAPGSSDWPYAIRIGKPSQSELERDYVWLSSQLDEVASWAEAHGLSYRTEQRKVGRMTYPLLSHVVVPSAHALAHAIGKDRHWELFSRRAETLRELFSKVGDEDLRDVLVSLNRSGTSDADFELVCAAARWFAQHDAHGYTPREVPLEGFHAKWLDAAGHRQVVCALAGLPSLELRHRPHLVSFHYLDPAYEATGARLHDTWLEGDAGELAYVPRTVVICENRDSALWFPHLDGAIAVQGDGMAGTAVLSGVAWIAQAEIVLYWGDIDIHGFQILSAYRERGLDVTSILMDERTYHTYERFGTSVDAHGRKLTPKADAHALRGLTDEENALYLRLCSPEHVGVRRIEQERIPLQVAQRVARALACEAERDRVSSASKKD